MYTIHMSFQMAHRLKILTTKTAFMISYLFVNTFEMLVEATRLGESFITSRTRNVPRPM